MCLQNRSFPRPLGYSYTLPNFNFLSSAAVKPARRCIEQPIANTMGIVVVADFATRATSRASSRDTAPYHANGIAGGDVRHSNIGRPLSALSHLGSQTDISASPVHARFSPQRGHSRQFNVSEGTEGDICAAANGAYSMTLSAAGRIDVVPEGREIL